MTENRRVIAAWLLVIVVTAIAGGLRFAGLGELGFFGDEETTSFAARALAEGFGPVMPSGMPYRRALPITWLSAAVARLSSLEAEFTYRAVPALLSTIAIPLIYLAGRKLAGTGAGLIAVLLFAFSGWHMVWSRTARMYGPLLTALVAFFYLIIIWKETGKSRYLAGAATMYFVGVLLHRVGISVALFPILLACMSNGDRVRSRDAIIISIVLSIAGFRISDMFIAASFAEWANILPSPQSEQVLEPLASTIGVWALGLIGASLGAVLAWNSYTRLPPATSIQLKLALAVLAVLTVAAGFAGWLWAAATLAVCWLIMARTVPSEGRGFALFPSPRVLALITIGTVLGATMRLVGTGLTVKSLVFSPFPYLPYLGKLLPLMIVLFLIVSVLLIVLRSNHDDHALRASVLFAWIYALLLGFDASYAPWRYLIPIYPWIVLTIAAGTAWMADALVARYKHVNKPLVYSVVTAIILAGGIGGHGIPAALSVIEVDYGERVPWYDQGLPGRPDHQSAGLFVRERLRENDIVIAEDPLQQYWYAGQADYWLRSFDDAARYLRQDQDGSLRDIYVWSEFLPDPPDEDWLTRSDRSVWLITSLETAGRRDLFLEDDQRKWIESIETEKEPAHVGRDGHTSVYCFGACPLRTGATKKR